MTTYFVKSPLDPLVILEVNLEPDLQDGFSYQVSHPSVPYFFRVKRSRLYTSKEECLKDLMTVTGASIAILTGEIEESQRDLEDLETRLVCYQNQLAMETQ